MVMSRWLHSTCFKLNTRNKQPFQKSHKGTLIIPSVTVLEFDSGLQLATLTPYGELSCQEKKLKTEIWPYLIFKYDFPFYIYSLETLMLITVNAQSSCYH